MRITNKISACIFIAVLSISNVKAEDSNELKLKLLNRVGYAPTESSLTILLKKNMKDWINEQLENPNKYSDKIVEEKIKNLSIQNLDNFQLYKQYDGYLNANNTPDFAAPTGILYENLKKRVIYAIYSENRIREMMVWFWFNHFSVDAKSNQGTLSLLNDYENQIREKSLGNFRDLLKMTIKHPAMLRYLNNTENRSPSTKVDPNHLILLRDEQDGEFFEREEVYSYNENYARELLELHTLGVDSGYTQKDIEELSRILTGFGMYSFYKANYFHYLKDIKRINNINEFKIKTNSNVKDNLYYFDPLEHDYGDKFFLGQKIKGEGEEEIEKVLDLIVLNKNTARFISTKLATYFLGEEFDNTIIKKLENEFLKSRGDISKVLKVLLNSEEFWKSVERQDKYKDLYSNYVSLYKLISNDNNLTDFNNFYRKLNEIDYLPYAKVTPEGYSLHGKDYISSQIMNKNINFYSSVIFFTKEHFKEDNIKFNYDFLSKIDNSIKDQKSFFIYLTSSKWLLH